MFTCFLAEIVPYNMQSLEDKFWCESVFEKRLETISRSEEADLHLNRVFLQKGSLPGINCWVGMSFERMLIVPWFKELFEIPVMQLC